MYGPPCRRKEKFGAEDKENINAVGSVQVHLQVKRLLRVLHEELD
jgi:hypothetical protein